MKRIFSLLLFVSIASSMVFADAYRDALMNYVNRSQDDIDRIPQALGSFLQVAFPGDSAKAVQIMTEYVSTQAAEDLADIYEPAFRKYVSLDDLNELENLYSNPHYQGMMQRSAKVLSEVKQSPEYAQFITYFSTAMRKIALGNKPEPLPVNASISEEYRQLFHTYYVESQIGEAMNGAFKPILGMLEQSLIENGSKNAETMVATVASYISDNMETLYLNIFSKTFTQDDLHLLIEASASPAQKHTMEATKEIVSNPVALSVSLMAKMSTWLQGHYPAYVESFNRVLEELKRMQ